MHINPSEGVSVNTHAGVCFPKGEASVCSIDNAKVEVVFYGELWLKLLCNHWPNDLVYSLYALNVQQLYL